MRTLLGLLTSFILPLAAPAAGPGPALETEDHKTLYALGTALAQQLQQFDFTAEELAVVQHGVADAVLGRDAAVELETYGPKIESYLQARMAAAAEREQQAGAEFRQRMAAEEGAVETDSGLIFIEQAPGTGASPEAGATVTVHYEGTFPSGKIFDSSRRGGEPAEFSLDGIVPCLSEGLQRLQVGGRAKLICPPDLAYGDQGFPPVIPPGATLTFDVELLGVEAAVEAGDGGPAGDAADAP